MKQVFESLNPRTPNRNPWLQLHPPPHTHTKKKQKRNGGRASLNFNYMILGGSIFVRISEHFRKFQWLFLKIDLGGEGKGLFFGSMSPES